GPHGPDGPVASPGRVPRAAGCRARRAVRDDRGRRQCAAAPGSAARDPVHRHSRGASSRADRPAAGACRRLADPAGGLGVTGADLATLTIRPGIPGVRRSQLIVPGLGVVEAAVEDDFHHFRVALHHGGGVVCKIDAGAVERWPWTTCPAAADHLAQRLTGARLDALAAVDRPQAHCTHMHELALLAASHAEDAAPVLYSSFIADASGGTQDAEVWIN